MTKELAAAEIEKYVEMMNAQYADGRPEIASRVSQDAKKETHSETKLDSCVQSETIHISLTEKNRENEKNHTGEIKHFRLKKEEEKIKMVIGGVESQIVGKNEDQRRNGESRS